MRDSNAEFQFIDFAKRSPNPEAPKASFQAPIARSVPSDFPAIRGALIGGAIGLAIWGALFGVWYWL